MADAAPSNTPSNDHIMGVYNRAPLAFERGRGVRLYTAEGEEYLDCVGGIATTGLGHANPVLVQALKDQAEKLWHVSNIYRIPSQEQLAKRLTDATFADVVFFTNSGTEAIECALKLARKHHAANGQVERIDIIGFDGAFHGRSYAAINAAGNPSYVEGFGPRLPGYIQLPFGDLEAIESAMGPNVAAIIAEPVQGEGGARCWPDASLRRLRELCDQHGALLIYDEVQCGMGRTGKLFAHEWVEGAQPHAVVAAAGYQEVLVASQGHELAVVRNDLQPDQQALAADVLDDVGIAVLQPRKLLGEVAGHLTHVGQRLFLRDLVEGRDADGHGQRIAAEGRAVDADSHALGGLSRR